VFCNKFVIHGGRRGNTVQALAQWQHLVVSSEALGVLYRAMRPALHCRIRMVIKITSDLPEFFVVANYLFAHSLI
jgi:hypothetical protein